MRTPISLLLAVSLLAAPLSALAIKFPDVPATYIYAKDIDTLSAEGVITGNADGTFRPHDPVNRSAILKLLYLAAGKTPESTGGCFKDLIAGSWYESFVCDAFAHGYVKGYAGDVYKPAQGVTRAEALKLALVILGIDPANIDADVQMYTDVSVNDWHVSYVHTALALKILPLAGWSLQTFSPNKLLERGEAAALINAAMKAPRETTSTSSSEAATSSSANASVASSSSNDEQDRTSKTLDTIKQEEDSLKLAQQNTKSMTVPFTDSQTFKDKNPLSYTFSLSRPLVVSVKTALTVESQLTCRLYHLGRGGFSWEYYVGFHDGNTCVIRAALAAGDWSLQLQPTVPSPGVTVSVQVATGDSNDGFAQAQGLPLNRSVTGSLDAGDLEDWYTFTVPKDATTVSKGGSTLTIALVSADSLGCLIYPMEDVDLQGFAGPQCDEEYLFPPGRYAVSVRHASPLNVRQTYSIQVR